MNFNAKDAKEFAKERKEGLDSATFAETFASFAVKFRHSLRLKLGLTQLLQPSGYRGLDP